MIRPKPVVLAILDGWGIAPPGIGNAITTAKTPNITSMWNAYVRTQLIAHGESVGLPKREPGNTETGHLNLGAGRIVYQDLPRINMSIADGTFFQNDSLIEAINHAKQNKSRLHLIGLLGGGGVHSDLSHLSALIRVCHEQKFTEVYIHVFTDGRDSPPNAAMSYVAQVKDAKFASVSGRYFAMDRDFRWERTEKAYLCLTKGIGNKATNIEEAISKSYAKGITDEFIEPTIIDPEGVIRDNDAVIFFNFRIDRPRQLTKAFVLSNFEENANTVGFDPYAVKYGAKHEADTSGRAKPFTRDGQLKNLFFVTMTEYERNLPVHVSFPPIPVENPLGRVVSAAGLKQLRISESEKERFVTYYFNGLREDAFSGEKRVIIPSPKVSTYDKKPEMSAVEMTDRTILEIQSGEHDLIIMNYANPDMVGHSGNLAAAIVACETVDTCVGKLLKAIEPTGGVLMITADHGNAEEMINRVSGEVDTEHNANPVPLIIAGADFRLATQLPQGILADVAPTILALLRVAIPGDMIGRNLLLGKLK